MLINVSTAVSVKTTSTITSILRYFGLAITQSPIMSKNFNNERFPFDDSLICVDFGLKLSTYKSWLPQVRKWSGKTKILQGQGKVREFYSASGKIGILKKSQGKLKL